MTLDEVIEARLNGATANESDSLTEECQFALRAHEALRHAVEETIDWPTGSERSPPELPQGFEIIRELGRGGMGVVYLARQEALDREVAVKVLRLGHEIQTRLVKRFLDEARHLAQLRHPNIVAVHEIGKAGDEPYFTMDYVPGDSLAHRLARGALAPAHAVAILKQVLDAVQHAHAQGIIHRDLKPGNVLLDESGHAYVTDFGLARDITTGSDLTRPGELLGTPSYMAPEQARGEAALIGEATDVFALGAILYEMLSGEPPFGHDAPAAVFARLLTHDPAPLRGKDRRIPQDLETICMKALAKDPGQRYATVLAMREDLRRFEEGLPITARRPGILARCKRLLARHATVVIAVALTAIGVAILTAYFTQHSVADLRTWAHEREAKQDYVGAADIYKRAWQKAEGKDRDTLREDLSRIARNTTDPTAAVTAARLVLEDDPRASFGMNNYLVAQALLADLRAQYPGKGLANIGPEGHQLVSLAETRLKLFLDSRSGTPDERRDAEEALTAISRSLNPVDIPLTVYREKAPEDLLPVASVERLRELARDPQRTGWDQALAMLALAIQGEERNDRELTREFAPRAFERMRQYYPMYAGVAASVVIGPKVTDRIGQEAPEAVMLRRAEALARSVAPDTTPRQRGGIRMVVQGIDWPADLTLDLNLELTAVGTEGLGSRFRPHRRVPFVGPRAEVGVTAGRYRLKLEQAMVSHAPGGSRTLARLLALDLDRVPQEITIDDKYQEIVIPARVLDEITLLGPDAGMPYDPTMDVLRWEAVPGATRYRVKLGVQRDRGDSRSLESLPEVIVSTTRVCLGLVEDDKAAWRNQRLRAGQTGTWSVEALDATGHVLAVSLETERPFLISRDAKSR